SRLGRWGVATAVAVAGSLIFATAANATVYRPTSSQEFITDLTAANINHGLDTIILPNETSILPPSPITISDDLIITVDHTWDGAVSGTFDGPQLSGTSVPPALRSQDGINISAGVRVAIAGIELSGWSDTGFYVINNAGSLRADNDMFLTN